MIPHPQQQLVLDSTARYRVVSTGRRWGKTSLLMEAIRSHESTIIFPDYKIMKAATRGTKPVFDYLIEGEILRMGGIRGRRLGFVCIDEPAFMHPDILRMILAVLEPDGQILAVGTPIPRKENELDLFIVLKQFVQSKAHYFDGEFWQFSSKGNNTVAQDALKSTVEVLAEAQFKSQLLGEFITVSKFAPETDAPITFYAKEQ